MSSYFLRTSRVLGATALVQTRKADCVCSTASSWFAGWTFCFASWAYELLTVKMLAPRTVALARSAVDEQGPRPWPYIYELVSMTPITSKDGKPSMALKALFHYRGCFGGAIQILVFLRVTLFYFIFFQFCYTLMVDFFKGLFLGLVSNIKQKVLSTPQGTECCQAP